MANSQDPYLAPQCCGYSNDQHFMWVLCIQIQIFMITEQTLLFTEKLRNLLRNLFDMCDDYVNL